MGKIQIPPFTDERIEALKEHVKEQRKIQQKHRSKFNTLLTKLDSEGVNTSTVKEICDGIGLYCIEHNRNIDSGITRFDHGKDRLFPEIERRHRAFTKHISGMRTRINGITSDMDKSLNDCLSEKRCSEIKQQIVANQQAALNLYKRALAYGMFSWLIELNWDNSRMDLFEYAVHLDYLDIAQLLGGKPLKARSHVWKKCIVDLDNILRPHLISKEKSAKMIAVLLHHRFPTIFSNEKKAYSKSIRSLRR